MRAVALPLTGLWMSPTASEERARIDQRLCQARGGGGCSSTTNTVGQETSGVCHGEAGAWLGTEWRPVSTLMGPSLVGVSGPHGGGHGWLVGPLV